MTHLHKWDCRIMRFDLPLCFQQKFVNNFLEKKIDWLDFKFSRCWLWKVLFCKMWYRADLLFLSVSSGLIYMSIFESTVHSAWCLFSIGYLRVLLFDLEDKRGTFLRNVCDSLTNNTMSHPRSEYSSDNICVRSTFLKDVKKTWVWLKLLLNFLPLTAISF